MEDIIGSKEGREIRRALAAKMSLRGFSTKDICELLGVSDSFVSKWKIIYEDKGADGLLLGYKGSESFLTDTDKKKIIAWLQAETHFNIEDLINHIEEKYGVVYKSRQSYYDLFAAARLSWHKSQKKNPRKDGDKVLLKREEIKKKLQELEPEIKSGELCVFMEDECHLSWGDTLGYVWGERNKRIEVPIMNERERQTYYGIIDVYEKEFLLKPYDKGNGANTVSFVKYLQSIREGRKLLIVWDKASYHRYGEMREYLEEINGGLEEKDWKINCLFFETDAPEQNPVEDIWLKGKSFLRKHFYENKTFAQVKKSFFDFLNNQIFDFDKLEWYI
jgi:putative transposase